MCNSLTVMSKLRRDNIPVANECVILLDEQLNRQKLNSQLLFKV